MLKGTMALPANTFSDVGKKRALLYLKEPFMTPKPGMHNIFRAISGVIRGLGESRLLTKTV